MKNTLKALVVLSICNLLVFGDFVLAGAQTCKIRAKIGIQINTTGRITRAKSQDHLNMNDLFRIYVHPEKESHVYVVHTDLKEATLLSWPQQKVQSSILVMPSHQNFYKVDGKSEKEIITIIVSMDELAEVSDLFKTEKTSYLRWVEVEKMLIEKGKIDLSQEVEKPFAIAGNVRGMGVNDDVDSFLSKLQIYSGKSVLVKKYEFKVKK
jgi:hypothetical protein